MLSSRYAMIVGWGQQVAVLPAFMLTVDFRELFSSAERSFGAKPLASIYDIVEQIWLGEKSTARNAMSIINRFPRRIKH